MERLARVNGIIITDSKGHYLFRPSDEMKSPLSNHHFFFRALTEDSVVLYGRNAWAQLGKKLPPADTAKILVGFSLEEALSAFPYRNILVVGNRTAMRNMDHLHNIVWIRYKSEIPSDRLFSPLTFEISTCNKQKLLCETPFYTIHDISICETLDCNDAQKINQTPAPTYFGADTSVHV